MRNIVLVFLGVVLSGGFVSGNSLQNGECSVVPMKEWAGEQSRRSELLQNPVSLVVVQHAVSSECNTDADCEKIVKGIRKYHLEQGFDDIGVSFLVGGNGKAYEGAGWKYVGAHTRFYNNKSVSLSFIGDYTNKLPTESALKAAEDLLSCGVKNSHLTSGYKIVGHKQLSPTLSPGASLQNLIETWPHWTSEVKEL